MLSRFPSEFTDWDLSLSDALKRYSLDIYSLQIWSWDRKAPQHFVFFRVTDKLGEKKLMYTQVTHKYILA